MLRCEYLDLLLGRWRLTTLRQATISFKGKQAKYTFPVGVSTLFWSESSIPVLQEVVLTVP